jgi:hypothetical protein
MTYKSELQRLQRLRRTDHQAFLDELDKPWPGMAEDLDVAIEIILEHTARSGDGRLPLLEACDLPDDPTAAVTVTLPAWWVAIIAAFRDLYAPAEAEYRTKKVLNELIGKVLGRDEPAICH